MVGSGRLVFAVQRQCLKTVWEWAGEYYNRECRVSATTRAAAPEHGARAVSGVNWQPGEEAAGLPEARRARGPSGLRSTLASRSLMDAGLDM